MRRLYDNVDRGETRGGRMGRHSADVSRRAFLGVGAAAMIGARFGATQASAAGSAQSAGRGKPDVSAVKALVFDTFGTVVDWRTSVASEVDQLAKKKGVKIDGVKFADAWRAG